MPQFQPDIVSFGDAAGMGAYDNGHYREHFQFVQLLAARTPPIILPNYDFFSFLTAGGTRKWAIERHMDVHNLLRQITNVQGVDLTGFDLDNEGDFYNFSGYHRQEHQQIRQVLGIT